MLILLTDLFTVWHTCFSNIILLNHVKGTCICCLSPPFSNFRVFISFRIVSKLAVKVGISFSILAILSPWSVSSLTNWDNILSFWARHCVRNVHNTASFTTKPISLFHWTAIVKYDFAWELVNVEMWNCSQVDRLSSDLYISWPFE